MAFVPAKHVFFLGLGGIGMSALARHLQAAGHVVAGYDLTPSPLLETLEKEGMEVTYSPSPKDLPDWALKAVPGEVTVVWTPAVPQDLPLHVHFVERQVMPIKRSVLLGSLTHDHPTLAVAGTHGKTTTSSWLAAMLDATPSGCHAFLGGLDAKHSTNYLTRPNASWHVVEADEYDRSFHHLHPTHAAITNLEPDHLDIYGSADAFREAFEVFGDQVRNSLLVPAELAWPSQGHEGPRIERFAVRLSGETIPDGVNHLAVLSPSNGEVRFTLGQNLPTSRNTPRPITFTAVPSMPGRHNTANALVAAALAWHAEVPTKTLADVVANFGGVKRRMDVHLDTPEAVYVDDYAHHPTELEALLEAVKERWPGRELTLVFQPHLFSRTRDFRDEFAHALGQADRVFILPIYPAREAPIEGVDAQWLFDNISGTHKHLSTSDSIFGDLKACSVDVLVTAGAGDIDRLVPQALQHMQNRRM